MECTCPAAYPIGARRFIKSGFAFQDLVARRIRVGYGEAGIPLGRGRGSEVEAQAWQAVYLYLVRRRFALL